LSSSGWKRGSLKPRKERSYFYAFRGSHVYLSEQEASEAKSHLFGFSSITPSIHHDCDINTIKATTRDGSPSLFGCYQALVHLPLFCHVEARSLTTLEFHLTQCFFWNAPQRDIYQIEALVRILAFLSCFQSSADRAVPGAVCPDCARDPGIVPLCDLVSQSPTLCPSWPSRSTRKSASAVPRAAKNGTAPWGKCLTE